MRIPLSLLKCFLDIEISSVKIGEILTLSGIEVDAIENEIPHFSGVIAVDVLSVQKHPDAKSLQIAQISDGKQTHQVVCGAPNCRSGIRVAWAKPGAILKDQNIDKGVLRGVESFGMLCSEKELGLSENHEEILELPKTIAIGDDLVSHLWDPVFELSLTPNLGHCMSALGIARELAAARKEKIILKEESCSLPSLTKTIQIKDTKLCSRYTAVYVENVSVGKSSFALKKQLLACGQKSVNNVVDAANFIMMKFGQPLHAFDYDLIEGNLHVGPALQPLKFLGLDQVEYEVPVGTLMIFDDQKPLAIAGVMGGANSAVSEKTTRVLFESAHFDPVAIRNAARKLGLRTESAQRFEKGVDPTGTLRGALEAAKLIGGSLKGFTDLNFHSLEPKKISYRPERINQLLGTKLSHTEIEELFDRLELRPKNKTVEVPFYRFDINEEIDLVEEAARIYGYNNIEKKIPLCSTSKLENDPVFLFENEMRQKFTEFGLIEFLHCDLIGPKLAEISQMVTPSSIEFLEATYSKSEEYSILRTTLLAGLLQSTKTNIDRKTASVSAFEIGRIHFRQKESKEIVEIPMGAIVLSGQKHPANWSQKGEEYDYFDLKGMIENLIGSRIQATFTPANHLTFHPGRQADIRIGDLIIGSLGEVHPTILEKFGIEKRVFYAEINLHSLMHQKKKGFKLTPLAQYPSSERDWTLPLDFKKPIEEVFQAINSLNLPLLESVDLIDLYIPSKTQKNATFRFTYRDPFKTVSFEEVEAEHAKMMENVVKLLAK
jgi:phenylalanyl-tRNA synthetase beta chain